MSKDKSLKSPSRRNLFQRAGVSIGAAGATALGLAGSKAKAAVAVRDGAKTGAYSETDHVKKAYSTARF
jgi:nitrous oxide reductase